MDDTKPTINKLWQDLPAVAQLVLQPYVIRVLAEGLWVDFYLKAGVKLDPLRDNLINRILKAWRSMTRQLILRPDGNYITSDLTTGHFIWLANRLAEVRQVMIRDGGINI